MPPRNDQKLLIALVIVATVAVAIVAATIGSVVVFDQDGTPSAGPPGETPWPEPELDPGDGDGPGEGMGLALTLVFCIEFLTIPSTIVGLTLGAFGLMYLVYWRTNLATTLLASSFFVPMATFLYFLLTNCPSGSGGVTGPPPGDSPGGTPFPTFDLLPAVPAWLIGLIVLAMALVAVGTLVTLTREDESVQTPQHRNRDPEPDAADFARAARRARQRIQEANVPVDNAVYQAWLEMTGLLAIEQPETTAPEEFADEAVNAGLARGDVEALTRLFTEVRYGRRDAETREARAVEILQSIEETYREHTSEQAG